MVVVVVVVVVVVLVISRNIRTRTQHTSHSVLAIDLGLARPPHVVPLRELEHARHEQGGVAHALHRVAHHPRGPPQLLEQGGRRC